MLMREVAVAGLLLALSTQLYGPSGAARNRDARSLKVVAKGFAYNQSTAAVVGVCQCKNGDLLVAYNTYTDLSPSERIALVRSHDGGRTWTKPEAFFESVFKDGGVEAGSSLTRLANGRVLLPYADGYF